MSNCADSSTVFGTAGRTHREEFHERDVNEEDVKPVQVKRRGSFHKKDVPKRSFEGRRQKTTRVGRVQQPR